MGSTEYQQLPEGLRIFGASDYATKDGEGDWTVHGVAGLDDDDNLYILDWWRQQSTPEVWIDVFCDLILKWAPEDWAEERGPILSSLDTFIQLRCKERRAYTNRVGYAATSSKRSRAQAIRGRLSQGKVFFPSRAPWLDDLILELMGLDSGADDQVDVLSLLGVHLVKMQPAGHLRNFSAARHIRKTEKRLDGE